MPDVFDDSQRWRRVTDVGGLIVSATAAGFAFLWSVFSPLIFIAAGFGSASNVTRIGWFAGFLGFLGLSILGTFWQVLTVVRVRNRRVALALPAALSVICAAGAISWCWLFTGFFDHGIQMPASFTD